MASPLCVFSYVVEGPMTERIPSYILYICKACLLCVSWYDHKELFFDWIVCHIMHWNSFLPPRTWYAIFPLCVVICSSIWHFRLNCLLHKKHLNRLPAPMIHMYLSSLLDGSCILPFDTLWGSLSPDPVCSPSFRELSGLSSSIATMSLWILDGFCILSFAACWIRVTWPCLFPFHQRT